MKLSRIVNINNLKHSYKVKLNKFRINELYYNTPFFLVFYNNVQNPLSSEDKKLLLDLFGTSDLKISSYNSSWLKGILLDNNSIIRLDFFKLISSFSNNILILESKKINLKFESLISLINDKKYKKFSSIFLGGSLGGYFIDKNKINSMKLFSNKHTFFSSFFSIANTNSKKLTTLLNTNSQNFLNLLTYIKNTK